MPDLQPKNSRAVNHIGSGDPTSAQPESPAAVSRYHIREFSAEDIADLAVEWNSLVRRSQADPLFMGWEWAASWWDVFGPPSNAEWAGIRAENTAGVTTAICPLFRRTSRLKRVLPVTRLEPLGGFWRGPSSVLTQYSQFLGEFASRPGLMTSLLDYLDGQREWSELVFPAMPRESQSLPALEQEARARGWLVRAVPVPPSQVVHFDCGFDEYRSSLSHRTRRRLFHRRRTLESLGRVEFAHVEWERFDQVIQMMNRFRDRHHAGRTLSDRAVEFHRVLMKRLKPRGGLRLSCLSLDDTPISVNYALRAGNKEYGVQMGFNAGLDRRLSLGMIHLGHALEAAAADGIKSYDLMGGPGPDLGWKGAVSNAQIDLVTLQLVRKKSLSWLYQMYDSRGRRRWR